MSSSRAKRKRRQRARAAGAARASPPAGSKAVVANHARSSGGATANEARGPKPSGADGATANGARGAKASGAGCPKADMAGRATGGGEVPRPVPIWAPFPLTEIGMAVGIIMLGLGLEDNRPSLMAIGAVVLAVVTAELCLREHFAGFRSHAVLLAALAVVAAHTAVVFAVTDAYTGPLSLAVDLAAGGVLAWWLRGRFRVARDLRQRTGSVASLVCTPAAVRRWRIRPSTARGGRAWAEPAPPSLSAARRLAIRRQLATTPGRLRLAAALLALGAIVFGIVAVDAADTRREAVDDVAKTEDLLVAAVDLSASLSDAHAIAALSFLVGGPEPAVSRRSYARALATAGVGLADLARDAGSSPASAAAVRRITRELPVYAGLIDSARANNRRGFPVGSAYLRRASKTMRDEILPAARDLYAIEARNLTAHYRAGSSATTLLAVAVAGCALLALLAATQIYLTRTTHRIVNVPLALASALLLGLVVWIAVAFAIQQQALGVGAAHRLGPRRAADRRADPRVAGAGEREHRARGTRRRRGRAAARPGRPRLSGGREADRRRPLRPRPRQRRAAARGIGHRGRLDRAHRRDLRRLPRLPRVPPARRRGGDARRLHPRRGARRAVAHPRDPVDDARGRRPQRRAAGGGAPRAAALRAPGVAGRGGARRAMRSASPP